MRLHSLKFEIGFLSFLQLITSLLITLTNWQILSKQSYQKIQIFIQPFQVSYQNLIYVHQMYQCLVYDHIVPATHHRPMVATN